MSGDQQNTVSTKASVFGLLEEAPMTGLHYYYYWLFASGGTLLDGFFSRTRFALKRSN
jgi:hypothetical protein